MVLKSKAAKMNHIVAPKPKTSRQRKGHKVYLIC